MLFLKNTQAVFPGRLELILGDSADTVPAFALREEAAGRDPRVCSVVLVDGDHSEEGVYTDLVNFQALTSRLEGCLIAGLLILARGRGGEAEGKQSYTA